MNKHIKSFWLLPLAGMALSFMPSCTTDSYGNSSVTPGGAAAIGVGALAAGAAIGAAVQHDRDKDRPPMAEIKREHAYKGSGISVRQGGERM